jgi:hypothetical protein
LNTAIKSRVHRQLQSVVTWTSNVFLAMKALSLQYGAHEMSGMNIVGACLYALGFTTVHILHYLPQLLRK